MYVELECQSHYSFLQGASSPDEIVDQAIGLGFSSLALTDEGGVYGLPKAFWRAKENPSFKLISGSKVAVESLGNLTLLAKSRKGYGLLCRLLTEAHRDQPKGHSLLSWKDFLSFSGEKDFADLFVLVSPQSLTADTEKSLLALKEKCEANLFITLQRHLNGFDKKIEIQNLEYCKKFELPFVATNQVLYHIKQRKPLGDILQSIKNGSTVFDLSFHIPSNAERYLKSPFEMVQLFRDLPQSLKNTVRIAENCHFSLGELRYRYPSEWIPQQHTSQSFLEEITWKGAQNRYGSYFSDEIRTQIQKELDLIRQLEFADYFLTIFDLVDFANKRNILCQGRGSAANSAVCYCLGITAIDPIQMNLLFERFISVERKEPPDIDVDFEHERREEVIQYIYDKYGRHRAAMVSAVVTYQKRSAFREVAKVLGLPVGTASTKNLRRDFESFAKDSPLPDALEQIEKYAEELQGVPRHLSIHSGGFTLSADPITEIVPVEPASMEGRTIIQWDKYDLDYLGLLKVDVLALGMLSALQRTLKLTGLELHRIPHEDKKTYQMIQKADTVGTFQVESRAQMNMSGRLRPQTFYDLVVQVAIVRPGPIIGKMVHPYLRRRQGKETFIFPHPTLKKILGKTLGVPLFQEQLMKIAIDLGDFTPGEADHLRRAIGAWRASGSIQKVAQRLLERMLRKGIPLSYAEEILEHMKGFAHYGFPESHAASFALLTYASCYLKCHYPAEFACGLLNSYPLGFYEPHTVIDDAKLHGVEVLPIDLHQSALDCTIEEKNHRKSLRLGLKLLRGISENELQKILQERPFRNLSDFASRTEIRKNILVSMAMGDLFHIFGQDQRSSLWQILAEDFSESKKSIQTHLWKGQSPFEKDSVNLNKMSLFEQVQEDYSATSVSTKAHPMQALRQIISLPPMTSFEVKRSPPKSRIKTAGLLLVRQKPPTANGVCFSAIEDENGILDLVLFPKVYEKYKDLFLNENFLIVTGHVERDGHSVSILVKSLERVWMKDKDAKDQQAFRSVTYF